MCVIFTFAGSVCIWSDKQTGETIDKYSRYVTYCLGLRATDYQRYPTIWSDTLAKSLRRYDSVMILKWPCQACLKLQNWSLCMHSNAQVLPRAFGFETPKTFEAKSLKMTRYCFMLTPDNDLSNLYFQKKQLVLLFFSQQFGWMLQSANIGEGVICKPIGKTIRKNNQT